MNQRNTGDRKKVVLGLSGGVDSTTAALLLQEKGYEVTGLYFDVLSGGTAAGCKRAQRAAEQLGIDFLYQDVSEAFEQVVIGNFCEEYLHARTPNPCVFCNPNIKFRTLLKAADEIGADYIATGHYADTCYDAGLNRWFIRRAANRRKDQSYMLYRLGQEVISRLLLPLNEIEDKNQVREIARSKALVNADAKDSQEICFIEPGDHYQAFLERRGKTLPKGNFVDADGTVLGEHQGLLHYTIGQRKGLGIALGRPAFVTKLDAQRNEVVLGSNEDLFVQDVLSADHVIASKEVLTGAAFSKYAEDCPLTAKIRYAAKPAEATVEFLSDGRILTHFRERQRAVTPGQSIVFYRGDLVVGGGFIES